LNSDAVGVDGERSRVDEGVKFDWVPVDAAWVRIF